MKRGGLYRVQRPGGGDPRRQRVFVVVSRQAVIDSRFSTVICAPVFTRCDGLSTQIPISIDEGLKHDSSIHCDQLVSLSKKVLTDFIGSLQSSRLIELDRAIAIAVGLQIDL